LKIRIVIPTGKVQSTLDSLQHDYTQASNSESEISFTFLSNGPGLDAPYNEITTVLPEVIFKIKEAEKEGVHVVVIAHYLDPGLGISTSHFNHNLGTFTYRTDWGHRCRRGFIGESGFDQTGRNCTAR